MTRGPGFGLTLERFCYAPIGTFGLLMGPEFSCYTVERPWAENRPWVSCIPEGRYPLRERRFNRGGYQTFEIVDVPGRSHILIHRGNLPRDVQGCVALGSRLGCLGGEWAVLGSRDVWRVFWDLYGQRRPTYIDIKSTSGGGT